MCCFNEILGLLKGDQVTIDIDVTGNPVASREGEFSVSNPLVLKTMWSTRAYTLAKRTVA